MEKAILTLKNVTWSHPENRNVLKLKNQNHKKSVKYNAKKILYFYEIKEILPSVMSCVKKMTQNPLL